MQYKRVYTYNGVRKVNCPNCGAAIEKDHCDFCGTAFVDMACVDMQQPFVLKINNDGVVMIFNVMLREAEINSSNDVTYANGIQFTSAKHTTIDMHFEVVNDCS